MDRNFLLAVALSFLVLMLWSSVFAPPPPEPGTTPAATPGTMAEAPGSGTPGVPPAPAPTPGGAAPPAPVDVRPAPTSEPEERVVVRGDLWEAEFTSHGGALVRWDLLEYHDASREGGPPVDMATLRPDSPPALATPLRGLGFGDLSRAAYRTSQPDPYTVVFEREQRGITVRKTYRLDPERYVMRLALEVSNGTERGLRANFETLWPAIERESADFREFQVAAFANGSLESAPVARGPSFLGMGGGALDRELTLPEERPGELDWAGAQMRYFLAALIPDEARAAAARFTPVREGEFVLVHVAFDPTDVPPGTRAEREYRVYLGPKLPDVLDGVGAHLDESILKGWFPSLTRFFTWLLTAVHSMIPNYGVAIIVITVLVRLLMAPIMARQMKSMKKLSVLQPKIKEVQEKYPDDRQKQSEAMMAVYREAGTSPFSAMAGCLPMLLQLPVFIGFYYALQGAIQLRQQPFFAWIDDLSEPESLFVIPGLELPVRLLPLLMGGSMVLQQKLTPTAMDPTQARMMLTIMPIMFTLLFYRFASGLVLYWLVSNLLGIGQQMLTNRNKD